jgi:hypothetical protein
MRGRMHPIQRVWDHERSARAWTFVALAVGLPLSVLVATWVW